MNAAGNGTPGVGPRVLDPAAVWYGRHPLSAVLLPLSWLYCGVVGLRRFGYRKGWLSSTRLPIPVIVVGNISVGGTGKTPLVARLIDYLKAHGWTPGVITRGYGGRSAQWPLPVTADSDPSQVGDEPVLLARHVHCMVVAGPDRVQAGRLAIELGGCDILVSDDGLQHYRLRRDLEVVLIDGDRGFGNGRCLPAGPLRELPGRLASVDLVLYKAGLKSPVPAMRLVSGALVNLVDSTRTRTLESFRGERLCAVAGIGNPEPFFAALRQAGLDLEARPYPDHHAYSAEDIRRWPDLPVIMTEKDAVKCAPFACEHHWYLPVEAELDESLLDDLLSKLAGLTNG